MSAFNPVRKSNYLFKSMQSLQPKADTCCVNGFCSIPIELILLLTSQKITFWLSTNQHIYKSNRVLSCKMNQVQRHQTKYSTKKTSISLSIIDYSCDILIEQSIIYGGRLCKSVDLGKLVEHFWSKLD